MTIAKIISGGQTGVDIAALRAAIAERLKDLASELRRDIVVNFAGNSEKTVPGIEKCAEELVRKLIEATHD